MTDWKGEYFRLLNQPNIDDVRLDAVMALKRHHRPRRLYRYRRVNLRDPGDYTLQSLASGETWLSAPAKLNDPFDCALSFSPTELANHWHRAKLEEALAATGHAGFFSASELDDIKSHASPVARMVEITFAKEGKAPPSDLVTVVQALSEKILRPNLDNLGEKARDSLRLCCFSENPHSILMWSHYAGDHQGICLEYDLDAWASRWDFRLLHPVHYSDERFDATEHMRPDYPTNVYVPIIAACNKASEWSYELEWRYVVPAGIGNANPKVALPHPSRIILGARAEPDLRSRLSSISGLASVRLEKARLSKTHFQVEIG